MEATTRAAVSQEASKHVAERLEELILDSYRQRNAFPKIEELSQKAGISTFKVTEFLKYFVKTGFLKLNYNRYYLNTTPKKEPAKEVVLESLPAKREDKAVSSKPTRRTFRFLEEDFQLVLLRIVMALIGTGAAIMSTYYTIVWLKEFLPFGLSLLLGFVMVIFSIFAFETMIYAWKEHKRWVVFAFIVPWVIVLVFSVTSTVAGQYNHRMKATNEDLAGMTEIISLNQTWTVLESEEAELVERISQLKGDIKRLQGQLSQFTTLEERKENATIYWTTSDQLDDAYRNYTATSKALAAKRAEKRAFLSEQKGKQGVLNETKVQSGSFYQWTARLFGTTPDRIEFWMSVFPAVFIDIIAPLAYSVALYLGKRKEE